MNAKNLIWILLLAVLSLSLQARVATADCIVTVQIINSDGSTINIEQDGDANTAKVGFTAPGAASEVLATVTGDAEGCSEAQVSGGSDGSAVLQVQDVQNVIFGDSITVGGSPFSGLTAGTDLIYAVDDYDNFQASDVNAAGNIFFETGGAASVSAGATVVRRFTAGQDIIFGIGHSGLTTNNVEVDANTFHAGGQIQFQINSPAISVNLQDFDADNVIQFFVDNAGPAANVNANNFNAVGDVQAVVFGGATRSFTNFVSQQGSTVAIPINGGDVVVDNFNANTNVEVVSDTVANVNVNNLRATTRGVGLTIVGTGAGTSAVDVANVHAGTIAQVSVFSASGDVNVQNIDTDNLDASFPKIRVQVFDVTGNFNLVGPIGGSFAGTSFSTPLTPDVGLQYLVVGNDALQFVDFASATTTVSKNGATAELGMSSGSAVNFFGGAAGVNDLVVAPLTTGITATATSGGSPGDDVTKVKTRSATFSQGVATITGISPFDVQIRGTGGVRLTSGDELQNAFFGQDTTAAFDSITVDSVGDPTGLVNGLVFAPVGNSVALNSPAGAQSCRANAVTADTTDEINNVFATNTQSGMITCLAQRFVTGSMLEIFEPTGITATELPFIYSTGDNYWDVSTSITPPDGCTVDKTTQSTTVDHSTEALVFTLNCGSSGATGAAITGAAAGGNGGASGKHVVKDCTAGKGCRVTNLNIDIPAAAQAKAAAPAKEKAPPINGAAVNGGSSVDPLLLVGVLAVLALVALVAFGGRKKK